MAQTLSWLALFGVVLFAAAQNAPPGSTLVPGVGFVTEQCETDVWDCEFEDRPPEDVCSPYIDKYRDPSSLTWVFALACIFAATMAFGIGANDAANSWGTTVGSRALPLRWAVLLGGIAEWFGAIALGYGVSKTIQKGVSKPDDPDCWACGYCNSSISVYMLGMMCSLIAATCFLALACFTAMPVSTTHAIIGAVVGMTIVGAGFDCLNWSFGGGGLTGIIASWVLSPLISGLIGSATYLLTHRFTLKARNPRRNALIALPILYGIATWVLVFLTLLKSKPTKKMNKGYMVAIAFGAAAAVAILVILFLLPKVKRNFPYLNYLAAKKRAAEEVEALEEGSGDFDDGKMTKEVAKLESMKGRTPSRIERSDSANPKVVLSAEAPDAATALSSEEAKAQLLKEDGATYGGMGVKKTASFGALTTKGDRSSADDTLEAMTEEDMAEEDAKFVYRYLLIFTATLESFAHGANDTANATGAFTSVFESYNSGLLQCKQNETPVWIMAAAGGFVFLGVNTLGYRVIATIGSELTSVNYQRGFCIEFASMLAVVIATIVSMPVSTTHCQVGAVVFVGLLTFGPRQTQWGLLGRIIATWVLTIPLAGFISAGLTAALRPAIKT